jgi:uncharacterized protein (DUF1697 family)
MPRYVAFLRAINVGGHVVKMDHLKKILESVDLSNVETFIASGNAVFESSVRTPRVLEEKIANTLQRDLGYEVATFIRTVPALSEIARYQPFEASELDDNGSLMYIAFVEAKLDPKAQRTVMSFRTKVDDFRVRGSEIYWLCRIRSSESEFSLARLEKAIAMKATFRNSTTVRKLAAKYAGPKE